MGSRTCLVAVALLLMRTGGLAPDDAEPRHYQDPNDEPLLPPTPREHPAGGNHRFSSIRFRTIFGMNVAVARNICVRPDGGVVLFIPPDDDGELLPPATLSRLFSQGQYGFRFGWEFYRALPDRPPPARWRAETAALVRPAVPRHLHHFAEAVVTLFHGSRYPAAHPFLSDLGVLLLPTVERRAELPWCLDFLDLVLAAAEAQGAKRPRAVFAEDWDGDNGGASNASSGGAPDGESKCFDNAVLVGMHSSEFGLFADAAEATAFRRFAYRHLLGAPAAEALEAASDARGANGQVATFVLERWRTRRLVNADDVRASLRATGLLSLDFSLDWLAPALAAAAPAPRPPLAFTRSFDGPAAGPAGGASGGAAAAWSSSLAAQVAWMAATDVLVGVHGAGLVNGVFLQPGSVVVDLLCPGFTELSFAGAVAGAGSHYLFLPNTNWSSGSYGGERGVPSGGPLVGSLEADADGPGAGRRAGAGPENLPENLPASCLAGSPTEAAALACLPLRNCDLAADAAALEGLARQAAMLVRLGKRRRLLARDVALTSGAWARGRLPGNPEEPLDPLP